MTARPFTPRGEEKVFYDRLLDHELVHQRCGGCGDVVFPLRTVCPGCSGEDLGLRRSAGRGRRPLASPCSTAAAHPSFPVPTTLALADMDEGFRLFASVPEPTGSQVGTPVDVVFDDVEEGLTLLRFSLGDGAGAA